MNEHDEAVLCDMLAKMLAEFYKKTKVTVLQSALTVIGEHALYNVYVTSIKDHPYAKKHEKGSVALGTILYEAIKERQNEIMKAMDKEDNHEQGGSTSG